MQFAAVFRLGDADRAADGREGTASDPDRYLIGVIEVQPVPELTPLMWTFENLQLQFEKGPITRLRRFHLRRGDDAQVVAIRQRIERVIRLTPLVCTSSFARI